jgi:hypothetical protein
MDQWPAIRVERFDGETWDHYQRRSAEVKEIIQGFRKLRFTGDVAERMEERLIMLQEPQPFGWAGLSEVEA